MNELKVFISWSGERSKHIALALKSWLPNVIQAVKPWVSESDIEAGQKWQSEISDRLNDTSYGIICVTPENQSKPWLNFEAGALSKAVKSETFVCPYLFKMTPTELAGPLAQFQVRKADKEGTEQLLIDINKRLSDALGEARLGETFALWWKTLNDLLAKCPPIETKSSKRSDTEILTEILENTRAIRRDVNAGRLSNAESFLATLGNTGGHGSFGTGNTVGLTIGSALAALGNSGGSTGLSIGDLRISDLKPGLGNTSGGSTTGLSLGDFRLSDLKPGLGDLSNVPNSEGQKALEIASKKAAKADDKKP